MSDQGEPTGPSGPGGSDERGGRDGGGAERGVPDRGAHPEFVWSQKIGDRVARYPLPFRIALGLLGPALLTTAYFTLPFDPIGPEHGILPWVICAGLLALLALGMVVTTNRVLTDRSRIRRPGVIMVLLSWAAILVFAASYWAMARHNQFVGLQTRLDALYFTGVTMATVGYGDIHPSGQLARAAVLMQLAYTFAFLVSGVTAIRSRNQARRAHRSSGGE